MSISFYIRPTFIASCTCCRYALAPHPNLGGKSCRGLFPPREFGSAQVSASISCLSIFPRTQTGIKVRHLSYQVLKALHISTSSADLPCRASTSTASPLSADPRTRQCYSRGVRYYDTTEEPLNSRRRIRDYICTESCLTKRCCVAAGNMHTFPTTSMGVCSEFSHARSRIEACTSVVPRGNWHWMVSHRQPCNASRRESQDTGVGSSAYPKRGGLNEAAFTVSWSLKYEVPKFCTLDHLSIIVFILSTGHIWLSLSFLYSPYRPV